MDRLVRDVLSRTIAPKVRVGLWVATLMAGFALSIGCSQDGLTNALREPAATFVWGGLFYLTYGQFLGALYLLMFPFAIAQSIIPQVGALIPVVYMAVFIYLSVLIWLHIFFLWKGRLWAYCLLAAMLLSASLFSLQPGTMN